MNKEKAIKATRNGAIAAVISALLTLVIVTLALVGAVTEDLSYYADPLYFADVATLLVCAIGLDRKSRVAGVLLVFYFAVSQFMTRMETGSISGILVTLVFAYFFVNGARGAFSFHKIERQENPEYRRTSKVWLYLGIPVLVIFIVLIGLGALTTTPYIPSTSVEAGSDIWQGHKDKLVSNDIINEDDEVVYFYSEGLFSVLEGGQLLTQDRVISYFRDEEEVIQVHEISYSNIGLVELVEKGGILSDTIYKVHSISGDAWLLLYLSVEKRGDEKFYDALVAFVEEAMLEPSDPN